MFGDIVEDQMMLNDAGQMIGTQWLALTERFTNVDLHEFIVMPNHFHGIFQIAGMLPGRHDNINVGAPLAGAFPVGDNTGNEREIGQPQGIAPTGAHAGRVGTNKSVGDIVDAFKSITTVEYIRGIKNSGWNPFNGKLWQRNYHDHIIRNEQSYQTIASYIINNPAKWNEDRFYNPIAL
jgi:putative transposase